jgi:hypothetical protein
VVIDEYSRDNWATAGELHSINSEKVVASKGYRCTLNSTLFCFCKNKIRFYITSRNFPYIGIVIIAIRISNGGVLVDFIPFIFSLLPILLVAFVLRWIRLIKANSDIQVEQNKKVLDLLNEINEKLKNDVK